MNAGLLTELTVVRHGEAHCNVEQVIGGPLGCRGLTERGVRQATRLARRLAADAPHDGAFDAVYASPLTRARQTAAIIASHLDTTVAEVPALAEQHHGSADGQAWIDIVRRFADAPALHPDRPLTPDGESWIDYLTRTTSAIQALIHDHAGERILIVAHGETTVAAHHLLLGLPADTCTRAGFAADQASLTRWTQQPASILLPDRGTRWILKHHNDTRHLHDEAAP